MNNNKLKEELQEIAKEQSTSIRKEVAKEFCNHSYDNAKEFFDDLQKNGCISGMITSLIYYCDTHKFFNTHYSEIEDLRYEYEEQGIDLKPQGDLMNWYAWFSFEEVAQKLANELGVFDG